MKKTILVCLAAGLNAIINAQSMEFLDVNRVKAAFWADGSMFWDKVSSSLFEWPQDSNTHVNYVTSLWLGGVNPSGTLKGAYMMYDNLGGDYYPGPLTIPAASVDSNTMALYNKVWKLNKTEVDRFILCNCQNPSDPSCAGYSIPASISTWPGNPIIESDGDHLLMDQQLAPYYDNNADGFYNPNDCDYPLIKCDQSLFYVFNDKGGIHGESLLPAVGVEVRAMAYACSCDSLKDAIFLDLEWIHRGTDTLYQTYMGLWSDGDLGGSIDDYIGTHVEEGYIYNYNGDAFDNSYGGSQGFGNLPPAHAMVYLQGPWMDANGVADFWDNTWDPNNPPAQALTAINQMAADLQDTLSANPSYGINGVGFNDTIIDNEKLGLTRTKYVISMPDSIPGNDFYRFQRAFWPDGTAQTYGGSGYPVGGEPRSWFVWSADSDPYHWGLGGISPSFNWSEYNSGSNPTMDLPNDRRSVSASGPFTMYPGERNYITYGFVTARSTNPIDSLSLDALHQSVLTVKSSYFSGFSGCGPLPIGMEQELEKHPVKIFPNPALDMVWIESKDLQGSTITIYDMAGRLIQQSNRVEATHLTSISVSSLAPGMYTVVISNPLWRRSLPLIRQ